METETNELTKEKKDNKKIIILIAAIIFVIAASVITVMVINNSKDMNKEIMDSIEKNKDVVIYVTDGKTKQIDQYVEKKNLKIKTFKVEDKKDADYNKLLKKYGLEKDVFGTPAILLIKEGQMYANIINIDSSKIIDQFIKDYNLK